MMTIRVRVNPANADDPERAGRTASGRRYTGWEYNAHVTAGRRSSYGFRATR